jgi:peptidoglycan/LPS O-acetylase OafA/YrhL
MVMNDRLFRAILGVQFAAVLGICFNHLAISLLKFSPPAFADATYAALAEWGVGALFMTSGFLLHWRSPFLLPPATAALERISVFLSRRFLWLTIPCLAVYLIDIMIISFHDFGPSRNLLTVAPLLITLSQTWIYGTVGLVSIGQPLNASNMAWIASALFFLSILYALTHTIFSRLAPRVALLTVLMFSLLHYGMFLVLKTQMPDIVAYGVSVYGDRLAPSYTIGSWLIFYSPYAHVFPFLVGVALAQMARSETRPDRIALATLAMISAIAIALGDASAVRFLGVNVAILSALIWWVGAGAPAGNWTNGMRKRFPGGSGFLTALGQSAYGLLIFHMIFYLPLRHQGGVSLNYLMDVYLFGRVLIVTAMVCLFSYGFLVYIAAPLRLRLLRLLGADLDGVNDQFI